MGIARFLSQNKRGRKGGREEEGGRKGRERGRGEERVAKRNSLQSPSWLLMSQPPSFLTSAPWEPLLEPPKYRDDRPSCHTWHGTDFPCVFRFSFSVTPLGSLPSPLTTNLLLGFALEVLRVEAVVSRGSAVELTPSTDVHSSGFSCCLWGRNCYNN